MHSSTILFTLFSSLASATYLADFSANPRSLASLDTRATRLCGKGSTCAEACGAGWEQCTYASDCYNPTVGDICCGDGTYCKKNTYCAVNGYCCDNGVDPAACAKDKGFTLPAGFVIGATPSSTTTTKPSSSPTAVTSKTSSITSGVKSSASVSLVYSNSTTTTTTTSGVAQFTGSQTTTSGLAQYTGAAATMGVGSGMAVVVVGLLGMVGL